MRKAQDPWDARESLKSAPLSLSLLQKWNREEVDGNQQKKRVHELVHSLNRRE
ncbi:hypothetical protein APY03_6294 [Variovorax sp. WDL1]|nr:hypothetical protein APY03_6294 [Variovorax sp. WDL1]